MRIREEEQAEREEALQSGEGLTYLVCGVGHLLRNSSGGCIGNSLKRPSKPGTMVHRDWGG